MNFAVVGGGFAGFSVCFHLFSLFPDSSVTLFDPNPIGENTSGRSSGLMHYFVGEKANKSWKGEHCFEESKKLLDTAQRYSSKNIYFMTPILRCARDKKMEDLLYKKSQIHEELKWLSKEESGQYGASMPGVLIKKGARVYPKLYLAALYNYCRSYPSFVWKKEKFKEELESSFTHVFFCIGDKVSDEFDLPFATEKIKGDMLVLSKKGKTIKIPIIGKGHITPGEEDQTYWLGATYEKQFTTLAPNQEKIEEMRLRMEKVVPVISSMGFMRIDSGIRLSRKGVYLPFILSKGETSTILGGFGSRGLLYHGFFGKWAVSLFAAAYYKREELRCV